jgi:Ca-activated chloride channel family protein
MTVMRRAMALPALAAAALAASAAVAGQEVFRGGTDLVVLSVTVATADQKLVTGLDRGAFQVFEDGVPQEIALFLREPQPIALSILLDSSTSMDTKLAVAHEAASGFVRKLRPDDIAQIIDFDNQPRIVQPFTSDHALLERAIRSTTPDGSTALFQSLYIALDELKRVQPSTKDGEVRRQAIVVLSDGEDNTSLIDYEQVLEASRRSNACVYAMGLRAKDEPPSHEFRAADWVLRTLSQETGGRVFFVNDPAQLPSVYGRITDELTNQYTIGYRSTNRKADGGWRRIAVKVTTGAGAARTRSGYFAARPRP